MVAKGFNGGLQFSSSASHGNFFTRSGGVCDAPRKRGGDGKRPAALQGPWSLLGVVVGVRGEPCNFEEWIEKLGLGELLDLPRVALSNGQTRRARIIKALLARPALLILDEPLSEHVYLSFFPRMLIANSWA